MKNESMFKTVAAFILLAGVSSAQAETSVERLVCTDAQDSAKQVVQAELKDESGVKTALVTLPGFDPALKLSGTFANAWIGRNTRVPSQSLKVTAQDSAGDVATILVKSFQFEDFSGSLSIAGSDGAVISQTQISCKLTAVPQGPDHEEPMPLPPHQCGRCAF